MTTLPVSIPPGFSLIVQKGDHVKKDDVLAKATESESSNNSYEVMIDLVSIFNESANNVRKYLQKGPGDSVQNGEIVAVRARSLGLKKDTIISHVTGTVIRFERDTGKLVIQNNQAETTAIVPAFSDILSPLAGTIKVCNNDEIVIVPDKGEEKKGDAKAEEAIAQPPKVKAGEKGVGGKVTGPLCIISPDKEGESITSTEITKETIGKILLLPDIDKEAIAKAAAIGVVGILGTDLSKDLFEYIEDRKIDIPLISIDQTLGKKLMKSKKDITINGKEQSVTDED